MDYWNKLKNENLNDDDFLKEDANLSEKEKNIISSSFGYVSPQESLAQYNLDFRKIKKEIAIPKEVIKKRYYQQY